MNELELIECGECGDLANYYSPDFNNYFCDERCLEEYIKRIRKEEHEDRLIDEDRGN